LFALAVGAAVLTDELQREFFSVAVITASCCHQLCIYTVKFALAVCTAVLADLFQLES
jgi:hypothetical protein